jgi:hypothetical protein
VGKPPCGAEPRIELGPALKPTEQRRTMLNNAAIPVMLFSSVCVGEGEAWNLTPHTFHLKTCLNIFEHTDEKTAIQRQHMVGSLAWT